MIRHFTGYTKSQIVFLLNIGYRHIYDVNNRRMDFVTNEENFVFSDKHKRFYFGRTFEAANFLRGELNSVNFEYERIPVHFGKMLNRKHYG